MADQEEQTFFRYTDAHGRDVVVNDASEVPKDAKDLRVMNVEPKVEVPKHELVLSTIDPRSFAFGFAAALIPSMVAFSLRRKKAGRTASAILTLGAMIVVVMAYFGWIMNTAGFAEPGLTDPRRVIEVAGEARDQANAKIRATEKAADALAKD